MSQPSTGTESLATQALFKAISNYSIHPDHRNVAKDAAALQSMREALAAGADWKAPQGPGLRDAAFSAATCADRAPLELLLAHGVPLLHSAGSDGLLIHRAAAFGQNDVIAMLVERGVAPDVRDPVAQRTPLSFARGLAHGERAVPFLIRLMRERGCVPAAAERGDDLRSDAVLTAFNGLEAAGLDDIAHSSLKTTIEGFFTERLGGRSQDFLQQLVELGDERILGAGLAIVTQASTAKTRAKVAKAKRGEMIHHGDLEITGDFDATRLVVTGHLVVHGLLKNCEGCVIGVGGKLKAQAVWSEGPLWVGGDLEAGEVFGCATNDYRAQIQGALQTPTLLQFEDHVLRAGELRIEQRFESAQAVPKELAAALASVLKMRSLG